MYRTKENDRLYLASWEYNFARILTRLAEIVKERGGRVAKAVYGNAIISNRTLSGSLRECKERLEYMEAREALESKPVRVQAIADLKQEIAKLEVIPNDPITVTHGTYLSFVLDGTFYSYSGDDNPFFDFHYQKTQITNGYYYATCAKTDPKQWMEDVYMTYLCTDEDIDRAANSILDMLLNANYCEVHYETKTMRVPNIYDNGFHYEKVRKPFKRNKIDF